MKLIIDRAVWLRGEGKGKSFLLRQEDGKRCCLGIYLAALGVSDELLEHVGSPARGLQLSLPAEAGWLIEAEAYGFRFPHENSAVACDLMHMNDAPEHGYLRIDGLDLTEARREEFVAARFKEHGVEVEFVG